jgi:hypothetical protein
MILIVVFISEFAQAARLRPVGLFVNLLVTRPAQPAFRWGESRRSFALATLLHCPIRFIPGGVFICLSRLSGDRFPMYKNCRKIP